MASTGNILDVAPQQEEHPTKAVNHEGRNAVVVGVKPGAGCGVKSPVQNNSDTKQLYDNTITYRGVAVSPAAPQYLLASEIVDKVELLQHYRAEEEAAAEEGALIEASGYQRPEYERNGR